MLLDVQIGEDRMPAQCEAEVSCPNHHDGRLSNALLGLRVQTVAEVECPNRLDEVAFHSVQTIAAIGCPRHGDGRVSNVPRR